MREGGSPRAGAGRARPVAVKPPVAAAPKAPLEILPLALLVLLCLCLLVVLRQRADTPLGLRNDSWSEANALVSARNAARNGWWKYGGVAQHQVDRPPFADDPFFHYAQYPLGASYVDWLLFDPRAPSPARMRWAPALCAVATLVCWYLLLCHLLPPWTALLSTAMLATSYGFLAYADDLFHGYSLALLAGMMLAYVAALESSGRRRQWLMGATWALLFANSFTSWEWYLWSQAFFWGHAWLVGVPFRKRWLLVFALAPAIAFAIQHGIRTAALGAGDGGGAVSDLLRRTIRLDDTADTPGSLTLSGYPSYLASRFEEFYGIGLGMLALLVSLWAVTGGGADPAQRRAPLALRWIALLFLCSVTWWVVMLQHSSVHAHVLRHALFFYALALGVALATAFKLLFQRGSPIATRVACAVLAAILLWPHLGGTYSEIRTYSDRDYVSPQSWGGTWEESERFAEVAREVPADAILLTNSSRPPLLRYWTDRPVYQADLGRHPFRRGEPLPGSREHLDLVLGHLKELYGKQTPRLLYVYFFYGDPGDAYIGDPILWQLVDGTWEAPSSTAQLNNFQSLATLGVGSSKNPVVANGDTWVAFDVRGLAENPPPEYGANAPPTRAEFGPPW